MTQEEVEGPGRDSGFELPQFMVEVNGLPTAICDAGHGPPLVLLHGLAGNLTHWVHVAPALVDRYRVIGIDLPGCGNSGSLPAPYSVDVYTEHVRGVFDKLGLSSATLIGHSLGGMISTEFALRHPHRTDGLVLVNPAGFHAMPAPLRLGGRLLLRKRLLDRLLPRAWKLVLANVFHDDNEHTERFVAVQEASYDPERHIGAVSRVIADLRQDILSRNYLSRLDDLNLPIGLIWGSEDRLVPAKAFREAAVRLPHVLARELEGAGHMPNIERPHEVIRFVSALLDRRELLAAK